MSPILKSERGFTLLEVLVALAVFAVVAAAGGVATQQLLGEAQGLRDRLFASWLADNRVAELTLQPAPAVGERTLVQRLDERQWTLSETVRDEGTHVDIEVVVGDAQGTALYRMTTTLERDDGSEG